MRLEELIYKLNMEIMKEFGIENAVHTIQMEHKVFDQIVIREYSKAINEGRYTFTYSPSSMNDFKICGVRVLARAKD